MYIFIHMSIDIKNKLRRALLEGKHSHKNEYGCVMVNLDIDDTQWKSILDIINDEDLYNPKDDPSYGKETKQHVTALFGLHADIEDKDLEKVLEKIKEPVIKLDKVSTFKNKLFDVVKFDVNSKDMHQMNKKLTEFPHTNTFPDYHPHSTIAYVKAGKGDEYAKLINDYLKDNTLEITPRNLVYSKVSGDEKTYKFNN